MNSPFETQPIQTDSPLKASGRFGRLSYMAWTFLTSLIAMLAVLPFIMLMGGSFMMNAASDPSAIFSGFSILALLFIAIIYIALTYFNFVFTIRRLHDRNHSGWLSLLMLVPFINLAFIIYIFAAKGNEGSNAYGPQRVTTDWERILGWIYIVLTVLGFVSAILIGLMTASMMGQSA